MIDVIARGMIEESNGGISQISEKVNNHTEDSDIHVTMRDKENWNSHPNDLQAEGNPVQMDNLQGGVPFSEMVVSGKNLLKYPYYTTTKTINGITFTDNGDGTITANGTATAMASFALIWKNIHLPKGTYTISGCPKGGDTITGFYIVCGTDSIRFSTDVGNGGTFSVIDDTNDFTFSLRINSGVTVDNVIFRPQLELGSTATTYEPPITGRELTVNVSGKNLLKNKLSTITSNGVTATVNDDGSITINRTASSDSNAYIVLWNNIPARDVANQKIAINAINGQSLETCYMGVDRLENGTYIDRIAVGIINNGVGIVTQEDVDNDRIFRPWIFIHKDYAPSNLIVYPQLELGDTATAYEPYHGSTTTITPDSNPYTVPNDIRQQDGLNVVSVSEGELSVTGVRKNAAVKKIWDEIGMDLLFDGVTSADSPAVVNLANYNMIRIDVSGNYEGTSYFNCGSTYFSKNTLDYAVTSYGSVAMPMSNQAVIINISKSGADYSLSFTGFNAKQLVDIIKIYGIK